jgi:hypothetical protein
LSSSASLTILLSQQVSYLLGNLKLLELMKLKLWGSLISQEGRFPIMCSCGHVFGKFAK